ncbi:MAG: tetratricopeptide repeat protein, partial [Treponema sp.]|nr:tetratricopeptide repeat protein [Treponema sp.]
FSIDPDIPIPVEIPDGAQTLDLEELSWEMIISGMLHVIAAGEEPGRRLDYYRHFVLTVRPAIMGEFTEAAIIKAHNGDFDIALEILNTLRGLFPASPVVMLNRALVLEQRAMLFERQEKAQAAAELQAAARAYEEALAFQPPFPKTLFDAGFFFLGQKYFSRARECFSAYTEIAEDDEKKEQVEAAIKDIDESGLEDESFREAYELIKQGEAEKGLRSIREFIEKRPSVWNGWFLLGWALRRLDRWEDGAAAFNKALELGGTGSDTRNELAICLMEMGDYKGARRELETALRKDPENIKIISNLGALAMKNGDDDEAAAFFRTALELDPDDQIAKKFLQNR